MTKSVRDAAIMLETMCGHDPKDSTSADIAVPNFEAMLTGDIRGKRSVFQKNTVWTDARRNRNTVAKWDRSAEDAGAEIVDISLPFTTLPAYYVIAPAEASQTLHV